MKIYRLFLALAVLITLACPVTLAASETQNLNTITVNGNGILEVSPDQAKVSISILTSAVNAQAARDENAQKSARVRAKLASMGIPVEKISTSSFTVSPVYSYSDKKQYSITGYEATNTIAVKLEDLSTVGTVIDAVLSSGANKISDVHFSKKNELELKQAVLKQAVKEATAKAAAIAEAMGKHLGKVTAVTENGISVSNNERFRNYSADMKAEGAAPSTNITAAPIQINGTINMVFEII